MPWDTSDRRSRLPKDWHKRRARVKRRAGGQCEWTDEHGRCPEPGNQCDHIIPSGSDDETNLRWLCATHHSRKTRSEAQAGKASRRRVHEPNPGMQ